MQKIYVKNIDCSQCAAKIEKKLKELDNEAKFSFPSCLLQIHTDYVHDAIKIIKNLEPKAEILQTRQEEKFSHQKISLIMATFIFALIMDFSQMQAMHAIFLCISYVLAAKNVVFGAFASLKNRVFFDENVLMLSASIAALFLAAFNEAVAIMVFYALGEHLQAFGIFRSKRSFNTLIQSLPSQVCILDQDKRIFKEIKEVQIGEIALFSAGDMISLDGEIVGGEGYINTQAINGESVPVLVGVNQEVLSGSVVVDSTLSVRVTKNYQENFVSKMQELLEEAIDHKTKAQSFITKFAKYYTPIVFVIALMVCLLPWILGYGDFREWLYRALVVLMVSCPCALVLAIPLGYFSAIGSASKRGILIKSVEFLEKLNEIDLIVFDKTGTLTQGDLMIKSLHPINTSEETLMHYACIAMQESKHSIAQSFPKQDPIPLLESKEIAGRGVVVKTATDVIIAGNARLMEENSIDFKENEELGVVVHVAQNGMYLGYILLSDFLKEEAMDVVEYFRSLKKDVVILSGDHQRNVQKVAQQLQCAYHAQALPQDKYAILQQYKTQHQVLFVGDGMNDAPTLASADIGVSMGIRGSDVSKQGADIILLQDNLRALIDLFKIAKKTKRVLWQNVWLALGIKLLFVLFGILGLANIWEAVFGDVGVSLLALLNTLRIFRI